ncbi:MAG: Tm-1-like ATP-binding domain-containing protein, partial [Deltaproteobacteria bacterium]|nr:Tm-1-like ATP-binding domain-containing protein [Deltaproteobacteria bacterium]
MPAYLSEWFGAMDISVTQVIMEFTGMNDLLTQAIGQVAGVISGMAEESRPVDSLRLPQPAVAVTEIGFSPRCSHRVGELLEAKGYHVYPFHAQGISERAMDRLIDQGFFQGLIDIVPAGLVEELFQGNRAAGLERLDAPCRTGIPQVLAPCTLNLTGCGPTRKNGAEYWSRERVLKIDALRAMTRYNADELRRGAEAYAEKLNAATGPTKFLFPLRGWSAIDAPGSCLHDPDQDRIFVDALRRRLKREVELVELDCNLEDPVFAEALVDSFHEAFRMRARNAGGADCAKQEYAT